MPHIDRAFKKNPILKAQYALALIVSVLLIQPALAQRAPDAGALQQELQRQIDRGAQTDPEFPVLKPKELTPELAGQKKFLVKAYVIQGNTLISTDVLQALIKPWEGRELSVSEIRQATTAISDRYEQDGRVARVFLPVQDIENNTVKIQIIEGRVGNINLVPDDKDAPVRLSDETIKRYLEVGNTSGAFMDSVALERSLIIANEIPGLSIAGSLEAGQTDGAIDIKGMTKRKPLLIGKLEASNYGASSTGVAQAVGNLTLNSLFGIGDLFSADIIESQGSTYVAGAASMPIGYTGWRSGFTISQLQYRTLPGWSSTPTQGSSNTLGLNSTYALQRTARSNMNINFGLDSKRYLNTVDAGTISDYSILSGTAGISGNFRVGTNGFMIWSTNLVAGNLTINDSAQSLSDSLGPQTAGSYGKLTFNASANLPFPDPSVAFVASMSGQLANKNLNSAEQFYLGGPYAMRAYPVAQGGGAQGGILSLELRHFLTPEWTVSAFADAGVVQQYVNTYANWQGLTNADNMYTLADAGLALKWSVENFDVTGSVAFRVGSNPLYNSSGQQLNADNSYRSVQGWIKASWYF
jgi:hemolysin activation/secretion protein